tara:strand:+ start:26 stop:688 length:663 start_codon:yes stop_codon:yes gene_type:complete
MSPYACKPTIGIISKEPQNQRYIEEIESRDGLAKVIRPNIPISSNDHLNSIDGIIVADHMSNPRLPITQKPAYDEVLLFLQDCLARKIPFLGIGEGMLTLNHLFTEYDSENIGYANPASSIHSQDRTVQIFVPPGTKLASIIGCGGFFKVDRMDHPKLPLSRISKSLMVNAYSLDGTCSEGIESIKHPWAIGINWIPYPHDQSSRAFTALFSSLVHCANK